MTNMKTMGDYTQKRFADCTEGEIIRFGDGSTGLRYSIVSIDSDDKRTAVIENMNHGPTFGGQQTVPIDDTTLVWARATRFNPDA